MLRATDPVSAQTSADRRRCSGIERWSRPLVSPWDRFSAWVNMLFADNGLIRLIYPNLHQVSDRVWRGGQPTPGQLRAFARRGGRNVVSLRAGRGFGSLPLELEACRATGLTYHNLVIRAHALPTRDELRAAAQLFAIIERPVLLHCMSGADRSGFASALFLMLVENRPVAEARRQLSLRYGHNPFGRAGLLDAFCDAYQRDGDLSPMPLTEWIETRYEPDEITAAFNATPIGARIRNYLRLGK
ncbi:MAG TPA: sulfur transferase domain-containing protein [Thermohalobaculum sp.]|nr:sulfur transferase domain-containing protein [Thermohalobaculum sp.]